MMPIQSRSFVILLPVALLALVAARSAQAQQANVYLNIPIELHNLMDEVARLHITCRITTETGEILGSAYRHVPRGANNAIQTVHQIEIEPTPPHNFSAAAHYDCDLRVEKSGGSTAIPWAEEPEGNEHDWRRFEPNEPFVIEIEGSLSPEVVQILQGNQALQSGE